MANQAQWQPEARAPLELGPADTPAAGEGEILVKNEAIALNPIDYKDFKSGFVPKAYPAILGFSFGGTVLSVGSGVSHIKKGDKVAVERKDLSNTSRGGFQKIATALASAVGRIPENVSVAAGAASISNLATIVPLLSVFLGVSRPPADKSAPAPATGKKILVYGGSTSTGGFAVRYASDAGWTVVTTSSPRNRDFVAGLGPAHVVDHTQERDKVAKDLQDLGPYDAVADTVSLPETFDIIVKVLGDKGGVFWGLLPGGDYEFPKNVKYEFRSFPEVLEEKKHQDLRKWFYEEYFCEGLESGRIVPTRQYIVDGGLEKIPDALGLFDQGGISGRKIVVSLEE